jgi:hypothetical protein
VVLAEAAAALPGADDDAEEPEVVDVGTGAVVDRSGALVVVVDSLIPPVMTDPVRGGLDQSVDVEEAAGEVPAVIAVMANEGLVLPESPNTDQCKACQRSSHQKSCGTYRRLSSPS